MRIFHTICYSEKLETEVATDTPASDLPAGGRRALPRTQAVVHGVLERLNLLLHVTIAPESGAGLTRSVSHMPDTHKTSQWSTKCIVGDQITVCILVCLIKGPWRIGYQLLAMFTILCISMKMYPEEKHVKYLLILKAPFIKLQLMSQKIKNV